MEDEEDLYWGYSEERIRDIKAVHKTQAFKKLWNYYLDLIETQKFQKEVELVRKKYNIPPSGFKIGESTEVASSKLYKESLKDIDDFCEKFGLDAPVWEESLLVYILGNEIRKPIDASLFFVSDIPFEKNDDLWGESFDEIYPIALRMSPYATQRDILDYVKKCYKTHIEFEQKKYRKNLKIGKIRTRKEVIRARNQFVYENKHLPRKKIWQLVEEKFGSKLSTDYGNIGKIISNEKRKRKEV